MTNRAKLVGCKFMILPALFALLIAARPAVAAPQPYVGVVITVAPYPLPVYAQPLCPAPGYIWMPGYWAWGPYGYFWVPGTWVLAPFPGALWTPGYWFWDDDDGTFIWNEGYWAPEVGYYGGIVYGFGYTGYGYEGGYWRNGAFYYNTAVNNVSRTNITNVYNRTVINNVTVNNVSYNGGNGGTTARPTDEQLAVARGRRLPPTDGQRHQVEVARSNRSLLASANHGLPPIAATPRPGALKGPGVVRASRAGSPEVNAAQPSPSAGGFHPFSRPNPNGNAQPRVQPGPPPRQTEIQTERPGKRPRVQPGPPPNPETHEMGKPANNPGKPAREKPDKGERHGPPEEKGPPGFVVNRVAPRPANPQPHGSRSMSAARPSGPTPTRIGSRGAQPQSNSAHAQAPQRKQAGGPERHSSF